MPDRALAAISNGEPSRPSSPTASNEMPSCVCAYAGRTDLIRQLVAHGASIDVTRMLAGFELDMVLAPIPDTMMRISIHTSPSARDAYGLDHAGTALRDVGLYVAIVEGPVSDAPESDFWFVFAEDIGIQGVAMSSVPRTTSERFVIMQPGRARAFKMLEELSAPQRSRRWHRLDEADRGKPGGAQGCRAGTRGRLRKGLILFGESERYSVWENDDIPTLAGHVARYLEAFGPRDAR